MSTVRALHLNDKISFCFLFFLLSTFLCSILEPCLAADGAVLRRLKDLLEVRHQTYLQTLEEHGPETIETRLAFDRYRLAYDRYRKAMVEATHHGQTNEPERISAPETQAGSSGIQTQNKFDDLLNDGPSVKSDFTIGNEFLKSGKVSAASSMYKMAFSKVFISPVKVFLMKTELFFDKLFRPKLPDEIDISDITPPPPPPRNERVNKPPVREDTSWIGDFKYERIMSDSSFTNVDAMTEQEVHDFLEQRGSVLSKPYRGQMPAELIMDACRKHEVSPKVLLARLQTEQGLISKKTASQHQLDWALGVGCYDSGNWNEKYKGLGKQIEYAAVTLKNQYDRGQDMIGQTGVIAMTIDGTPLRIQNAASYSMYKYCPHKHGNKLFYDVYAGFFALLLFIIEIIFL